MTFLTIRESSAQRFGRVFHFGYPENSVRVGIPEAADHLLIHEKHFSGTFFRQISIKISAVNAEI